ncbi:MAG: Sapep family Mn(2+)-dependent dipeptidase [Clostridiales bacterium]|nr:Sapep family Mn(2+)-dependent dipeptidase [Clostridiales bacterium]
MKEKIKTYAKEHLQEMLQDIKKVVAVRSIKGDPLLGKPFGEGPAAAVSCMEEIAKRHGFRPNNFDNYMLTVNLNDLPDELGILCHLDVVHEGTGWTTPPYEMDIRDGKIYGRGTADNKGPAVAALYALKCVRDLGIPLKKNVRLMLGTNEESGMKDLPEYFKREAPPPFSISPDAAFPIYNIEKGRFGPTFAAEFKKDDTLPRILSIDSGHAANIVPGEACAVVCGLTAEEILPYIKACEESTGAAFECEDKDSKLLVKAKGLSAHAAYPGDGNNAATAIIALLTSMPMFSGEGFERLKGVNRLLPHGGWDGKNIGIKMEDKLSGILTCNLGIFKYSETGIVGRIDIRSPICSNEGNCSLVMEKSFNNEGFKLDTTKMVLPHYVPEELPFIQTLKSVFEECTGLPCDCVSMGGGTYVHGIPNSVAFGAAFPDTETYAHSADEYAVIDELEACVSIFANVIVEMCK